MFKHKTKATHNLQNGYLGDKPTLNCPVLALLETDDFLHFTLLHRSR